jgi:hypothetical protein
MPPAGKTLVQKREQKRGQRVREFRFDYTIAGPCYLEGSTPFGPLQLCRRCGGQFTTAPRLHCMMTDDIGTTSDHQSRGSRLLPSTETKECFMESIEDASNPNGHEIKRRHLLPFQFLWTLKVSQIKTATNERKCPPKDSCMAFGVISPYLGRKHKIPIDMSSTLFPLTAEYHSAYSQRGA